MGNICVKTRYLKKFSNPKDFRNALNFRCFPYINHAVSRRSINETRADGLTMIMQES